MGHMHATEFASAVEDGTVSLDQALAWHLRSNHFPPVPLTMVPVCAAAIEAVNDDDLGREIDLPDGVTFRGASRTTAHAIVESHHLHAFLNDEEED